MRCWRRAAPRRRRAAASPRRRARPRSRAVRAAGGAAGSELDVQPLRDPQVEDLRARPRAAGSARASIRRPPRALDQALADQSRRSGAAAGARRNRAAAGQLDERRAASRAERSSAAPRSAAVPAPLGNRGAGHADAWPQRAGRRRGEASCGPGGRGSRRTQDDHRPGAPEARCLHGRRAAALLNRDFLKRAHGVLARQAAASAKPAARRWPPAARSPRNMPGFAVRAAQQDLAAAVADAIESRGTLLAEAGTGTGKTFAYLVPALLSGQHTIVSTGTRALQDQLYHRDLPRVRDALGIGLKTALLKGRANYLCHYRMRPGARASRASASARAGRAVPAHRRLVRAARACGDLAELDALPDDSPLLPQVTSTAENCLGSECPFFADCFVVQARQRAQAADLVVVNHHLLLADLALKQEGFGEILPGAQPSCSTRRTSCRSWPRSSSAKASARGSWSNWRATRSPNARQVPAALAAVQEPARALEQAVRALRAGDGRTAAARHARCARRRTGRRGRLRCAGRCAGALTQRCCSRWRRRRRASMPARRARSSSKDGCGAGAMTRRDPAAKTTIRRGLRRGRCAASARRRGGEPGRRRARRRACSGTS